MRRANEVTFSRPISWLRSKQSWGLSLTTVSFFCIGLPLWVQALPLKNQFLTRLWPCFLKEWIGSAVWISLFIYCVGFFFFSSFDSPSSSLTFVCISAHRRGSWSVERPVGMVTLRCRVGWVGEEVSYQEHCRYWGLCCLSHPPMRGILLGKKKLALETKIWLTFSNLLLSENVAFNY